MDARELQGRPTGVGRYLRNLIRGLTEEQGDSVVAYVAGEPPADRVLDDPLVEVRSLAPLRPGLAWQQLRLASAVRSAKRKTVSDRWRGWSSSTSTEWRRPDPSLPAASAKL